MSTPPVITERQLSRAGLLLGGGLGVMNLIGTLVVLFDPDHLRPVGFHPLPLLCLSIGGTAFVLVGWRRPELFRPRLVPLVIVFGVLSLTIEILSFGPSLGAYVAMSYLWIGMACNLLFKRLFAVAAPVMVGVAYALVLHVQHHNPAPLAQWIVVVGLVGVSGILAGTLGSRIRHLTAEEQRLRTEVERGRSRLESANAQRQEFLAGMSHELRTPLNAIIGFADVLRDRLFGPLTEMQEKQIDRLSSAGRTLLALVDDVLDLDSGPSGGNVADRSSEVPTIDRGTALRADPRGAMAFFVLIPLALLAIGHRPPAGFHRGWLIVVSVIGALLDLAVFYAPGPTEDVRAFAHLALTTAVALLDAAVIGAAMAPFATMAVVWMATAASIRLSARAAAAQLALTSAGVGILVSLQPGNADPFIRWMMVTGTSLVSAIVIRGIVNRLLELAEEEARTRRAADRHRRELETATRHKLEFLRNVRAELRPPVEAVTAAAGRLADGAAGPLEPRQAEYAADIAGAGGDLWSLINDMLDLATVQFGTMPLELDSVDVDELVHAAVAPFERKAAAGGVALTVEVGPSLPRVPADASKLRRAVAGLVSNAIKFTPPGGSVAVRVSVGDGALCIDVADTGPGIPPEDRERIFEGFQQGAPADIAPGAGVGLTLARRFAELQGGRVELLSGDGPGSVFRLMLPVTVASISPGRAASRR